MAWRIHEQVVRGVIDNRIKGQVTGKVWVTGGLEPLQLNLQGNAWPDLAGCLLTFVNPHPQPDDGDGPATEQNGVCGDMTASRKVKVPTVNLEDWLRDRPGEPFPYVWGNSIYLEWFSERSGRVVIESATYEVTLSEPSWRMTAQEETRQHERSSEAMAKFMGQLQVALDRTQDSPVPKGPSETNNDASSEQEVTRMLDQVSRIENLKARVREIVGGEMLVGHEAPVPLDIQEQFWQHILDCETVGPLVTRRKMLADDGIHPPPPETLSEPDITEHLWALIRGLANRGFYLDSTDHLSDRELYQLLVKTVLAEETEALPADSGWVSHIFIHAYGVPGDENGDRLYLQYYADCEFREQWAADFPDDPIPPHDDPPYNRDLRLPQPELPGSDRVMGNCS